MAGPGDDAARRSRALTIALGIEVSRRARPGPSWNSLRPGTVAPAWQRGLRRLDATGPIASWGINGGAESERILADIIRSRHRPLPRPMPTLESGLADPATIDRYQPVIGLEVHVQLKTRTKIFSHSTHRFGEVPNSQTDPVVLGLPGALPVLNEQAVSLAVRASLAINCRVNRFSRFARKNYFYPDLPKGYQISQFDQPLAEHGWLDIRTDGGPKRIGVTRLHMEEDAGKTIHDGFSDSRRYSYVDLNRAGAPLCEIVSEPDLRSADEAVAYLNELKLLMQFAGVSDCDMEKGQLRCDANVSVRPRGATRLGTRSEIKNLNSFRFVKQAIQYEIARQAAIVESGGAVYQESRLFNTMTGTTSSMRGKEDSHDYRYFPETRPAATGDIRRAPDVHSVSHAGTSASHASPIHPAIWALGLRRARPDADACNGLVLRAGGRFGRQCEGRCELGSGRAHGGLERRGQVDRGFSGHSAEARGTCRAR